MITTVQQATDSSGLLEVTPDVGCLQLSMVNVYFYGPPGAADRDWVLIDTGLFTSGASIRRAAAARFSPNSRPTAIILTHGHFDHVGSAKELAELWDVPVYAHELEMPYLTGESPYPPPDPVVGGGAMAWLSPLYPRGPVDLRPHVHSLPADGTVPEMPGWRWLPTPGHAPGHVSLFRDSDRALIAGDAFVTTKQESAFAVMFQPKEVCRPPAYYTPDWQSARRSVQQLAELEPSVAGTGHGLPMSGEPLRQGLNRLARDFDRSALPHHGRYIHQPAITNEHGIVRLPPPVFNKAPLVLAGLGVAALATWAILSAQSPHAGRLGS